MSSRILVGYATKNGSTAEIAQAVGKEIQAAGYTADVAELKSVSSVDGYAAVVIGAPLYMNKLHGDAGAFVGRYREQLARVPVAAFAVGLAPVAKEPGSLENAIKILHASVSPLQPVAETVFAGNLDPAKVSFVFRKMIGLMKIPTGDFRDWNAIAAWAREVPGKMGLPPGNAG